MFIKVSYNWKDRVWSFILQFGHVRWNAFSTYKVESSVKKCQFVKVQNKFGIAFFMDFNKPTFMYISYKLTFLLRNLIACSGTIVVARLGSFV